MKRRTLSPAVAALVAHADLFALRYHRAIEDCDVVCVFEADGGGVADTCIVSRGEAADATDDLSLGVKLFKQPRGALLMVLAADGSTWIQRASARVVNAPGGEA